MTTAAEVPFLLHGAVTVLQPPSPVKPVFIDSSDTTDCSCRTRSYGRGRRSPLPWSLQCRFRYWKWQLRLSSTAVSTVMTMTTPRPKLVNGGKDVNISETTLQILRGKDADISEEVKEVQISLSGILEINGVDIKHKKEIKSDQHGTLVLENSIGVYHDHFYIYHLDLDIDGVNNSFEKTSLKTVRVTDGSSKRKSYWTTETETAESENDAKITIGSTPGELSVVNPNKKTSVGNDVV
ncbi:hypothetical protein VIGAN_01531800 [Vigna angularis var. angularis]|uniref:Amine oxidase n=1 Tax=Vigna angularis var. angularis TaxID=157739 RepID=A0A0S3R9B4_PHAAN|nr:hypothetical protein VIGAN_01531800 [Vigna angularis var. angularis]